MRRMLIFVGELLEVDFSLMHADMEVRNSANKCWTNLICRCYFRMGYDWNDFGKHCWWWAVLSKHFAPRNSGGNGWWWNDRPRPPSLEYTLQFSIDTEWYTQRPLFQGILYTLDLPLLQIYRWFFFDIFWLFLFCDHPHPWNLTQKIYHKLGPLVVLFLFDEFPFPDPWCKVDRSGTWQV